MLGARLLKRLVVPKCEARALEVPRGTTLRIITIDGPQVADATFIRLNDPREGYHAGQTVALNLLAGTGTMWSVTHLYSKPPRENVMMTVVDDTVGVHFAWNGGRCSRRVYEIRDGITSSHRTCQDNLGEAIAPWGLDGDDVPDIFNAFMQVEVINGRRLVFKPSPAKPDDYIDLCAQMDLLVAVSACPSETSASNAYEPKRLLLELWQPA